MAGAITGVSLEEHSGWRDKFSDTIETVTQKRVRCFNIYT